jgi:hypothetical protein
MPRATTIEATTSKHRPPPSLCNQRSASQREESDARNQKEGDDRKEKGLWKNHCSHSRMWCELQKSCRQYNPTCPLRPMEANPLPKARPQTTRRRRFPMALRRTSTSPVGGALVGLAEGHPIKTTKEVAGEIWSVSKVIDCAGGWF